MQKAEGQRMASEATGRRKKHRNGKFVTLTFSNKSILELTQESRKITWEKIKKIKDGETVLKEELAKKEIYKLKAKLSGYKLDNEIATLATRRFLERWRKENKKSLKRKIRNTNI